MSTIREIFDDLAYIANAHIQVESVKSGVMDKLANENYNYPLVNFHVGEGNSITVPKTKVMVVMSVLDMLDTDLSDEIDKISNAYEIGLGIVSQLTRTYHYPNIDSYNDDIEWEQVLGQTGDFLGGVQFYLPIRMDSDVDGCNSAIIYD